MCYSIMKENVIFSLRWMSFHIFIFFVPLWGKLFSYLIYLYLSTKLYSSILPTLILFIFISVLNSTTAFCQLSDSWNWTGFLTLSRLKLAASGRIRSLSQLAGGEIWCQRLIPVPEPAGPSDLCWSLHMRSHVCNTGTLQILLRSLSLCT